MLFIRFFRVFIYFFFFTDLILSDRADKRINREFEDKNSEFSFFFLS